MTGRPTPAATVSRLVRIGLWLACCSAVFAFAAVAQAHSRWVDPPARSLADGLTDGPCGGVAPTATITELPAGGTVELAWIITQPHGGSFRVALGSSDDLGFDDAVLFERPEEGLPQDVTQAVELPACTCDACTLQLLQLTASGNGGYYSCADVRLVADPGDGYPPCETAVGTSGGGDTTVGGDDSSGGTASVTTGDVGGDAGTTGSDTTTADGEAGTAAGSESGPLVDQADAGAGGCACTADDSRRPWGGAWLLPPLLGALRRRAAVSATARARRRPTRPR
ncbi:MAG: lytic polysaccharide monooxygenase [Deltaproteobacteria bacterium]|nr:lytic polysaccharide monooxygenase [Deltaproteobacteria bacterium]